MNKRHTAALILFLISSFLATHLRLNVSTESLFPKGHKYLQVFLEEQLPLAQEKRITIQIRKSDQDIFNKPLLQSTEEIYNALFTLPFVDRTSISSLFSPEVSYAINTEDGYAGSTVIPENWRKSQSSIVNIRSNIKNSEKASRFVSPDYSSTYIFFTLGSEVTLASKEAGALIEKLENIRLQHEKKGLFIGLTGGPISAHVFKESYIRFLKYSILTSFALCIIFLVTHRARLDSLKKASFRMILFIGYSLGFLFLFSKSIHPLSLMLYPLLLLWATCELFALKKIRLVPYCHTRLVQVLLLLPIYCFEIPILTHATSIGVSYILSLGAVCVLTQYQSLESIVEVRKVFFPNHSILFALAIVFLAFLASHTSIGSNNTNSLLIPTHSRISSDIKQRFEGSNVTPHVFTVFAKGKSNACTSTSAIQQIHTFSKKVSTLSQVRSTIELTTALKLVRVILNERNYVWNVLPKKGEALSSLISLVRPGSQLLNFDCSTMPIYIFLNDRSASSLAILQESINTLIAKSEGPLELVPGGGSIPMLVATNERLESRFLALLLPLLLLPIASFILIKNARVDLCLLYSFGVLFACAISAYCSLGLSELSLFAIMLGVCLGIFQESLKASMFIILLAGLSLLSALPIVCSAYLAFLSSYIPILCVKTIASYKDIEIS